MLQLSSIPIKWLSLVRVSRTRHTLYVIVSISVALLLFLAWSQPLYSRNGEEFRFKNYGPIANDLKPYSREDWRKDPVCQNFLGSDNIVVTVKTGATEALLKLPVQMRTSLRCAPNVIVFSDMEQDLDDKLHLFDALDSIPDEVKRDNSDFDIYREQQAIGNVYEIIDSLRSMKDPQRPNDYAAWTLDKYKQLHIIEKAWKMLPEKDWYFHMDADTYVIWASLLAWVQKLDPSKELYIGSLALINELSFLHGGSGFLMSREATRNIVVNNSGTAAKWDYKMSENCCGDWVLGQIVKEYGMEVMSAWPTINGESPSSIPFAKNHWCQPLVTMHHVTFEESQQLGSFESRRANKTTPILYADIFKSMVASSIPDFASDWDNISSGKSVPNIPSVESCNKECSKISGCFQYTYDGSECKLGTENFRLGGKRKAEGDKKWQSGWKKERIEAWISKQAPCSRIQFPFQS